ncbi:MAG: DsbA family protein [Oxalobacteraceae bacterium]
MASAIDFYFDFSSPYGYFAAMRIDALAARYGRHVEWHPILLGVVFKTTGGSALPLLPLKGPYALHDFERTARFHGIPFKLPAAFPLATQGAARAMLWVHSHHGIERAIAFAKAVYTAYFAEGVNIGEPMNVVQIGTELGLDPHALATGMDSAPIRDQLKAEIKLALARDVFGSPFVIIDGEAFWGFDRLEQMEALLKNGTI